MTILWFTNTPANAAGFFKDPTIKGGWLQGLNKEIEDKVNLHVAFFNPKGPAEFTYGNTKFHSIIPKDWKLRLILNSFFNLDTERNDKALYLQIINKVKPDLIHIHGTENGYISILSETRLPVIVSLQGITTVIYKKHNADFSPLQLRTVSYISGLKMASLLPKTYFSQKKSFLKRYLREQKFLSSAKYVEGRTDWDKRVASILAPGAEYFHVDRILRNDFYQHTWKNPGNKVLQIHSTSGAGIYKGLETIFEAAYELNNIGFKFNWNIAGVSKGDPILSLVKKHLKSKYSESGINFLGKQSAGELIKTMIVSDLFVMTSHIENSPNNLAEAMILGMPCIATHAGGTSTYIKDGENGILIQDGDPWSLAGAILELWNNKEKALALAKKAKEDALERHSVGKITNSMLKIYESIIGNKD